MNLKPFFIQVKTKGIYSQQSLYGPVLSGTKHRTSAEIEMEKKNIQ